MSKYVATSAQNYWADSVKGDELQDVINRTAPLTVRGDMYRICEMCDGGPLVVGVVTLGVFYEPVWGAGEST